MCYEKQELLTHREHLSSLLGFWWGPFCPSFKFFSVVLLCILTFWVPCCDVRYDFRIKRSSVNLYLQLFVGGLMSYLRYLWLFAYSGVQHILWCVFVLLVFVLCLVYPMLPVSLNCPILIEPSVSLTFIYSRYPDQMLMFLGNLLDNKRLL